MLILDLIKADNGQVLSKDFVLSNDNRWKEYTGSFLDEGFLIDFLKPEEHFKFIAEVSERIVVLEKGLVVKDLFTSNNTLGELEGYFNHEATVNLEH